MPRTVTGAGRGGNGVTLPRPRNPVQRAPKLPEGDWKRWERLILERGAGWLAETDAPLVRQTARALARRDLLGRWLDDVGPTAWWTELESGRTFPHAAWSVMGQLEAQVTSWLGLLGFTPQDRARMKLDQDDAAAAVDELRKLREAKRAG